MNSVLKYFLLPIVFLPFFVLGQEHVEKNKIACIGFYNLENFYDTINQTNVSDEEFTPEGEKHYTGKVYRDKLHKLVTVIQQIGADVSDDGLCIMGCAEIENHGVLEDLVKQKEIRERDYRIVQYNSPDERGVDVALLYSAKVFRVLFSEPLFVPLKNDDGTPRYTRDVLYVKGILREDTLNIFVNHWPSRRGGEEASAPSRAIAAGVCRHKIDSLFTLNKNSRIIVMGDLNDDPVNASVTNVLRATGDRTKAIAGKLFNPWVTQYKAGIGTLAYQDSWNLFDQIIISPALLDSSQEGFSFTKAVIFNRDFLVNKSGRYKGYPKRTYDFNKYIGGYSDHFPTYIILKQK